VLDDFAVRVSIDGPCRVRVTLEGDIDFSVAPLLESSLRCAAEVYDQHHIDLDMSAVTFMDCSGLAVLVDAHRRLATTHSHLAVVNPAPMVLKVIELTGTDSILDIRSGAFGAIAPHTAQRPSRSYSLNRAI
jgi:anti-sigma B factor antagonist